MADIAAQLAAIQAELQQLRATQQKQDAGRQGNAEGAMVEDAEEDTEAEEVDGQVSWSDVLSQTRAVPSSADAIKFTKLLASPPSLQALRACRANVRLYCGVPESPPPRRNRVDSQLQVCQQKIELALHLITHFFKSENRAAIGGVAAWLRSAWEDMNQQEGCSWLAPKHGS